MGLIMTQQNLQSDKHHLKANDHLKPGVKWEVNSQVDEWIITCKYHIKDPLSVARGCYCHILMGKEARKARMWWKLKNGHTITFGCGDPFISSTFMYNPLELEKLIQCQ